MKRCDLTLACALALGAIACGDNNPGTSTDDSPQPDAAGAPDAAAGVPPVTELAAAPAAAGGMDLTWTNPAGIAGVLVVARADEAVDFTPTDGTSYAVDDPAGPGGTVLSTALVEELLGVAAVPAVPQHYAAWAFDDAGSYSPVAITAGSNRLVPTQHAQIELHLDGTVTVVEQPPDFELSGSLVYDDVAQFMDVTLSIENARVPQAIFHTKLVVEALNQGNAFLPLYPARDPVAARPTAWFGALPLVIGGPSATMAFPVGAADGVGFIDGTVDPVVLDVRIENHDPLLSGGWESLNSFDSSGSGFGANFHGFRGLRFGALSPDRTTFYTGSMGSPAITVHDLVNDSTTTSVDLVDDLGSIGAVALSPDGATIYAVLGSGAHINGGDNSENGASNLADISLVALDAATLAILDTVELATDVPGNRTRSLAISPDGTRAAAVVGFTEIALVDLTTMTQLDADPDAAGINLLTTGEQPAAMFSDDSQTLWTATEGAISSLDLTTLESTTLDAVDTGEVLWFGLSEDGDPLCLGRALNNSGVVHSTVVQGGVATTAALDLGAEATSDQKGLINAAYDRRSGRAYLLTKNRLFLLDVAAMVVVDVGAGVEVGAPHTFRNFRHGALLAAP